MRLLPSAVLLLVFSLSSHACIYSAKKFRDPNLTFSSNTANELSLLHRYTSSIMGNKTTDEQFKKTQQVVGANGGQTIDDLNGKIMKEAPGHDGVSSSPSFIPLPLLSPIC